jgi:hypothetical protein
MALETKITTLEKKAQSLVSSAKKKSPLASQIYTITYKSSDVLNNNLTSKYTDLSDTEAKILLDKLNHPKRSEISGKIVTPVNQSPRKSDNNLFEKTSDETSLDLDFSQPTKDEYRILDAIQFEDDAFDDNPVNVAVAKNISDTMELSNNAN